MRIREKIKMELKSEVAISEAVKYKRDYEIRTGENNMREYKIKIRKKERRKDTRLEYQKRTWRT